MLLLSVEIQVGHWHSISELQVGHRWLKLQIIGWTPAMSYVGGPSCRSRARHGLWFASPFVVGKSKMEFKTSAYTLHYGQVGCGHVFAFVCFHLLPTSSLVKSTLIFLCAINYSPLLKNVVWESWAHFCILGDFNCLVRSRALVILTTMTSLGMVRLPNSGHWENMNTTVHLPAMSYKRCSFLPWPGWGLEAGTRY